MFFEDFTEREYAVIRKDFDRKLHGGPRLTLREHRILRIANKRSMRALLTESALVLGLLAPVYWIIVGRM